MSKSSSSSSSHKGPDSAQAPALTPQQMALQAREEQLTDLRKSLKKAGATIPRIVNEFAAIAFSSIDDYIDIAEGGEITAKTFDTIRATKKGKLKIKALKKVEEHTRITESADGERIWKDSRIKFECYDKLDALKYISKLAEIEPADKVDMTVNGNLAERLRDARERTKNRP